MSDVQAALVSEVQPDGSTEIIETRGKSNYEGRIRELNGTAPNAPPVSDLSKLFTPKFVIEITAPDGTIIPFTYKKVSPMDLLMSHGSPIVVTDQVIRGITNIREQQGEDGQIDDLEALKLLQDDSWKDSQAAFSALRKVSVQGGIISPIITDEFYEQLDPTIINALYQAVTGGITSDTELVDHFRRNA